MNSKRFELDLDDLRSILRQIIILYTPVITLFLEQIASSQLEPKFIISLFLSTTVDIIRRFITDYSNGNN